MTKKKADDKATGYGFEIFNGIDEAPEVETPWVCLDCLGENEHREGCILREMD